MGSTRLAWGTKRCGYSTMDNNYNGVIWRAESLYYAANQVIKGFPGCADAGEVIQKDRLDREAINFLFKRLKSYRFRSSISER